MIVAFWKGAAAGAGFAVAFWTTLIVYGNEIERAVARRKRQPRSALVARRVKT